VRIVRPGATHRKTAHLAGVPAQAMLGLFLFVGCTADAARTADAERVSGGCRVVGGDAATGERVLRACIAASNHLARILGMPAPSGVIMLTHDSTTTDADVSRRATESWAMAIPRGEASPEMLDLGAGAQMSAEGYLTHEAAHRIAYAMLYPSGDEDVIDSVPAYGSPLPDWLDEALGQLTEPADDQHARMAPLSDGPIIYALPLRRFLYMPHPALQGVPAGAPLRRVFYGQSIAFALFLSERGGIDGFREFVRALRGGQTQGVALTSIPGLPADGGELEATWLAWLRNRQAPATSTTTDVAAVR
jgi:hypothetical protein